MAWLTDILAQLQQQGQALPTTTNDGGFAPLDQGQGDSGPAAWATVTNAMKGLQSRQGLGEEQEPLTKLLGGTVQRDPRAQGAASTFQINNRSGSDREGQAYRTIDVDGTKLHVYYDEDGRRRVVRVSGNPLRGALVQQRHRPGLNI